MNIEEFKKWCDKKNNKEVKKNGSYAEDFIYFDHREGNQKITFLDTFVKVLGGYWLGDCFIDEHLGFITDNETVYINEEFLDFCIENDLEGENAYDFYQFLLEKSMGKEIMSYKEGIKLFKK